MSLTGSLPPGFLLGRWPSVLRDTRVRERASADKFRRRWQAVSQRTLGPLGQPEIALGRESPIEPWLAPTNVLLAVFSEPKASLRRTMKTAAKRNHSLQGANRQNSRSITWAETQQNLRPTEKCFFLTSPFIELISEFRALTGVPAVVNTSFNDNEPIVCRPEEAIDCFLRTRMDTLVLGDFLIRRPAADEAAAADAGSSKSQALSAGSSSSNSLRHPSS